MCKYQVEHGKEGDFNTYKVIMNLNLPTPSVIISEFTLILQSVFMFHRKLATEVCNFVISTPRKDFVILQLYWCLFSSTKHVVEIWSNAWYFYKNISHHIMCNGRAIHTMTIELHYKLHSKLLPVICTVK